MYRRSSPTLLFLNGVCRIGAFGMFAIALLVPTAGQSQTTLSGFTIGSYTLQSSLRYSQYLYNYTLITSVTNSNATAYSSVLGTVTSSDPNTTIVAGEVEFGNVPAASKALGLTTFTIRHDSRYTFDPSTLAWTFTGTSSSSTVGTTPSTVSLTTSATDVSYGTGVTLIASVSPSSATGTVTFYDGPVSIGSATLSSGTATLSSFVLAVGTHYVSAVYKGNTTYALGASGRSTITVASAGDDASCASLTGTEHVVCLANAFEATLNATQLSSLVLDYTLSNVEHWSNLPLGVVARNGLQFSTLSSTQLAAALEVANASMSTQGFARMQNIRGADDILNATNSRMGWGAGNYFIAFYGAPSTTSPWMLQINGHHFAFNHTFNGKYISGTPYFIGTEPVMYNVGPNVFLPMETPRRAAYVLSQSIFGNSNAVLSGTFDDVVMGVNGQTGIDTNYPQTYPTGTTGRGVLYSSLTANQQLLIQAMIKAWVADMDSTTATALLTTYTDSAALSETYVGYSGTGNLTEQGDYIRIDGPRVWIEFCVQNGIAWPASYHFHTIWRDKAADYGGDFVNE